MKNLENLLNNTDFSRDSKNKEAIKAMLLNTLKNEEQEKYSNKETIKNFRFKPMYLAAAAVAVIGISIAACGEDMTRIIQQFTVGRYATFVGTTVNSSDYDETQARLIAENENVMVTFIDPVFSYEAEIEREKGSVTYFNNINDVKPYLAFNPLIPVSLPGGFALDRISLFNDENGRPLPLGSNMYLNVYYTDTDKTQQIYIQIRMMNEETALWASAGHDMRYISINGHEGVAGGKNVHVEIDGVMYMILADRADEVTQGDVIRMAESLR